MRLILLILIISGSCFAQSARYIKKGDKAPWDGVLLTEQRAEKAMKAEKKVPILQETISLQEDLSKFYKEDRDKYRNQLTKERFGSNIKHIGYFVLGAVITSLTFKLNQKVGDL
jgi:hypothetical protein